MHIVYSLGKWNYKHGYHLATFRDWHPLCCRECVTGLSLLLVNRHPSVLCYNSYFSALYCEVLRSPVPTKAAESPHQSRTEAALDFTETCACSCSGSEVLIFQSPPFTAVMGYVSVAHFPLLVPCIFQRLS